MEQPLEWLLSMAGPLRWCSGVGGSPLRQRFLYKGIKQDRPELMPISTRLRHSTEGRSGSRGRENAPHRKRRNPEVICIVEKG